jgi:hypothetical protein
VCRERGTKKEALAKVTAEVTKYSKLGFSFDMLGDARNLHGLT